MKKLFFILLTLSLSSFGQTAATILAKSEALVAKIYKAQEIKIGSQTWISKNLDVSSYRNGEPITEVQDKEAWAILTTGAWCYYENKTANGTKYGKLYNWYAVNDPRGLAPNGYHIPTDAEWTTLSTYLDLDGGFAAGKKMKSTIGWDIFQFLGSSYIENCLNCKNWSSEYRYKVACHTCKDTREVTKYLPKKNYSGNGTNASGFAGLPSGARGNSGDFGLIGVWGSWWSSSEIDANKAWMRNILNEFENVTKLDAEKNIGSSVRCLKD